MEIELPELCLVLLIGASGAGKSTFAKTHFAKHETVSSDFCRGVVSNDENSLAASKDAFELLNYVVSKRLERGLLTVVDATNVQQESRKKLLAIAREYHVLPVAIVLNIPAELCKERNESREERNFGKQVIYKQIASLRRSLRSLKKEGFKRVFTLKDPSEIDSVKIQRSKLYNDKKDLCGPFDIVGDIHGCLVETQELLLKLGYWIDEVDDDGLNYGLDVSHPEERQVIFLGDLVDRGPDSPGVLKLAMSMVRSGRAFCVPGNHDAKLQRKLRDPKRSMKMGHGLKETMEQLATESEDFREDVREFIYSLVSHLIFDGGNLLVAHAGLVEEMHGRTSGAVRAFCLYGETRGEMDDFGFPIRHDWSRNYKGRPKVIYGHTTVMEAKWRNRTMCIDTGCVFGGKLSALRYPEEELVSIAAKKVYWEPKRPLENAPIEEEEEHYYDLLDIDDVIGKHVVQTRLRNNITIREANSIAALETISRFAVDPKWLIYLPPTMSPCATHRDGDFLEHPEEALAYFREAGLEQVVCEKKHMGSRAVVIVCKDKKTSFQRFGVRDGSFGCVYTRSGRAFFTDENLGRAFINAIREGLTESGFWSHIESDWVCMDAELMPWSEKAKSLLKEQYAAVGTAAANALSDVNAALEGFSRREIEGGDALFKRFQSKETKIEKYIQSYRNYCWEVRGLDDYKLAPFHILASEKGAHLDEDHCWHMDTIATYCTAPIFQSTPHKIVDLGSDHSEAEAVEWWLEMTGRGEEGMVVKPLDYVAFDTSKKLIQPAIKCRGKEYLRIIYGPDYDDAPHLKRLKGRGLSKKRALALQEFALGVESLERFVGKESLRSVHECVFGVLALESEKVDPRL